MGFWSCLPRDILEVIADKLVGHSDLLRFGAVCSNWHFVYRENCHRLPRKIPMFLCLPQPIPLLLRSYKQDADLRQFVCLTDEMTRNNFFLPEAVNKWICGTSHGWLVTVDIHGQQVQLLNPFTKAQIALPSLATFTKPLDLYGDPDSASLDCFQYISKAVISADPTTSLGNCTIMVIASNKRRLSFCKVGDDKWTNKEGCPYVIEDLICQEGRFYVVNQIGCVVSFDAADPNEEATIVAFRASKNIYLRRYLVISSSGVLLMVSRIINEEEVHWENGSYLDHKTLRFKVFKLVKRNSSIDNPFNFELKWNSSIDNPLNFERIPSKQRWRKEKIWYEWARLESLGDEILFLGNNSSMSLPAHLFPNCKGNCIFFTDDHFDDHASRLLFGESPAQVNHDIGVYDMEDGSIQAYHQNDPHEIMPSIWFMPNPW